MAYLAMGCEYLEMMVCQNHSLQVFLPLPHCVISMNVSLLWFYICCVKPCEIQVLTCANCVQTVFISPFDPSALYYLISEPTAENQQVTAPQMSVFVSLKFEVLEVV